MKSHSLLKGIFDRQPKRAQESWAERWVPKEGRWGDFLGEKSSSSISSSQFV